MFAYRRGAVALVASQLENSVLVEEVAGEMRVEVAEDGIILDERRWAAGGVRDRMRDVERIREHTGVAKVVPGGDSRGISHGEGWKQRMTVHQRNALTRQCRKIRRRRVIDNARA